MRCRKPTALYKIGTGEDIKAAPAPGMFDIKVCIHNPCLPRDKIRRRQR